MSAYDHRPQMNDRFLSRRQMLQRCGMGIGALGLTSLLADLSGTSIARAADLVGAGDGGYTNPLAPRQSPLPARAKRVIHFFLNGGPSHVDTFDPKSALTKFAGKPFPGGNLQTERKTGGCLPSPFGFKKC